MFTEIVVTSHWKTPATQYSRVCVNLARNIVNLAITECTDIICFYVVLIGEVVLTEVKLRRKELGGWEDFCV
jgi:hypothetical protein